MARHRKQDDDEGPEFELDLHQLRGPQALRRLAQEMHAWRVRGLRRVLIITGRGIRSDAGPVLVPLVEQWLKTEQARDIGVVSWKSTHAGGAFDVRLNWDTRG
ncbi:MAG: DNA-nicking Smr family endonuclease [Chlamydiales bacterium]|jgi:DNA-nicking Smr family endonuclease